MSSIRNYEGRIKQMMESDGITREEAKKIIDKDIEEGHKILMETIEEVKSEKKTGLGCMVALLIMIAPTILLSLLIF
tara:strand:- start:334 stop:564 length:231 start_codon:yes stop_codon:yes gene_type:complete